MSSQSQSSRLFGFAIKPSPTRPSAAPRTTNPTLDCSPVFGNSRPLGFSGVGGVTGGVGGVGVVRYLVAELAYGISEL